MTYGSVCTWFIYVDLSIVVSSKHVLSSLAAAVLGLAVMSDDGSSYAHVYVFILVHSIAWFYFLKKMSYPKSVANSSPGRNSVPCPPRQST